MSLKPGETVPTPTALPPDILRAAYIEVIVTDLAASREFYVDVLGLVVTAEDDEAIYLRTFEEFIHHNIVLRKGDVPACRAFSFRVRTPEDVDRAEAYFTELGCKVVRNRRGFVTGIGDSVRVEDPYGFPFEFFHEADKVERLTWHYDEMKGSGIARLDHFNQVTPDVHTATAYLQDLGFKLTEQIADSEGTIFASWLGRSQTVHDTALTGGPGPMLHHIALACHERGGVLNVADRLGALRKSDCIERGPGRHGVSNAFYLYLRDPDGHRIEIYTQDYYTGDPDNPVVTWDVHDNQRRDWWGNPIVHSWYNEASPVLDLDGNLQPLVAREEASEEAVTVGADGFTFTRPDQPQQPAPR